MLRSLLSPLCRLHHKSTLPILSTTSDTRGAGPYLSAQHGGAENIIYSWSNKIQPQAQFQGAHCGKPEIHRARCSVPKKWWESKTLWEEKQFGKAVHHLRISHWIRGLNISKRSSGPEDSLKADREWTRQQGRQKWIRAHVLHEGPSGSDLSSETS